eukprot:987705_1
MRSDRSVISFSIWTLPLQTMTKVPSCTGDQISDTTDDETNNLGCEGNVYPYECNYDDAALSGCSLVVKLAIQACNINGYYSIGEVQDLIKTTVVEIVAGSGTTECTLEQCRAFDFSPKAIGTESNVASRSSYKPEIAAIGTHEYTQPLPSIHATNPKQRQMVIMVKRLHKFR